MLAAGAFFSGGLGLIILGLLEFLAPLFVVLPFIGENFAT